MKTAAAAEYLLIVEGPADLTHLLPLFFYLRRRRRRNVGSEGSSAENHLHEVLYLQGDDVVLVVLQQ